MMMEQKTVMEHRKEEKLTQNHQMAPSGEKNLVMIHPATTE